MPPQRLPFDIIPPYFESPDELFHRADAATEVSERTIPGRLFSRQFPRPTSFGSHYAHEDQIPFSGFMLRSQSRRDERGVPASRHQTGSGMRWTRLRRVHRSQATSVVNGSKRAGRAAVLRTAKPCDLTTRRGCQVRSRYRFRDDGILHVICPTSQTVFAGSWWPTTAEYLCRLLCMGLFSIFCVREPRWPCGWPAEPEFAA